VRNQGSIEHDSIPGHTLWSVMDNTSVSCQISRKTLWSTVTLRSRDLDVY
jgi:hypothetical protein